MTGTCPERIEVITSVQRRRRWSAEEKLRIVAESLEGGVSVAAVARRHEINANQLHTWRRQAREGGLGGFGGFVPVHVIGEAGSRSTAVATDGGDRAPLAEIIFPNGLRLRVASDLEQGLLARLVSTLLATG